MSSFVLKADHIEKDFHDPQKVAVLKDISFQIEKGEFTSIVGKSGCGKSTLLYILSTMDTDYRGNLIIDGIQMTGLIEPELAKVRN